MSDGPTLGRVAESFLALQPFRPDRFQREAIAVIERGESVVVTAPTGAGKTLIAEAAIHLALANDRRAFYTAPIKALSNQKFTDFTSIYGRGAVGLLTGDNVINGDAPLVVMTTEVLRNMIYAESGALESLGVVVLDEVHYLQDRYRGSVWEEVIIHLPRSVALVNLSATIANAGEFTSWIMSRRGPTGLVTETTRPVPLSSTYLVKDRYEDNALALFPLFESSGRRANPELVKMLRQRSRRFPRFGTPRRLEVAESLACRELLPAIYFIFSRAGCEQAARVVAESGLRLTSAEERREIATRVLAATGHVVEADLEILGFGSWAAQLQQGVAAHHAGMVPAFKEAVEDLFAAGLVKLVFATETLALGINMPARAVVLERLSKFTGESHETLEPGDYTQLTGRAGRRGIDKQGTAVVLHDGRLPIERVAAVAAQGSHPLKSSFQPSYNMAVNLVATYDQKTAEDLLSSSFAQFRREQRREDIESRVRQRKRDVEDFRARAECDRGSLWDYLSSAGGRATDHLAKMSAFVRGTRSGDVLRMSEEAGDRAVLLARGRGANPRILLVSAGGEVMRLTPGELSPTVAVLGNMVLPEPIRSRDRRYRASVAGLLRVWQPGPGDAVSPTVDSAIDDPVATCPDLADHLGWVRRIERAEGDLRKLQRRLRQSTGGLVPRFRAIQALLGEWGYLAGDSLTEKGTGLRFVYNELDLLLAEAMARDILGGLDPADLAASISVFTYQPRAKDIAGEWPSRSSAEAGAAIIAVWVELSAAEGRHGIPETRRPESGFAATAHAWTSGYDLSDLFDDDEVAAGDFVRNCRQLLDLLRQLRDNFPQSSEAAGAAIRSIDRGIVSAGGRL